MGEEIRTFLALGKTLASRVNCITLGGPKLRPPAGFPDYLNDTNRPIPVAEALDIAKACARYADDLRAEDILVIDLRGLSSITDFFVICTGTSTPHLKAIRRDISQKVAEEIDEKPRSVEGDPESHWLVIDFVDVIVHVFHEDKRAVYGLEDLWKDAPRVSLDFLPAAPAQPGTGSSDEA